jgi:hypothetical protein
MAMPLSGLLF